MLSMKTALAGYHSTDDIILLRNDITLISHLACGVTYFVLHGALFLLHLKRVLVHMSYLSSVWFFLTD